MPALRAVALLLFLVGTALLVAGILREQVALTVAGVVLWVVGVTVGLFVHRLFNAP
jgi:hypothetical protein